eukprot:9424006-Karenia_brevis.AAC.1
MKLLPSDPWWGSKLSVSQTANSESSTLSDGASATRCVLDKTCGVDHSFPTAEPEMYSWLLQYDCFDARTAFQ